MKSIVFVLLLCFISAPVLAQDENTDTCDPFPIIPVTVSPVLGGVSYDYGTSISGLEALERSTPHFYERLLLGVTTYTPVADIHASSKIIKAADGGECVKITGVELKVGYDNIVMHVANEIPQGTCGFSEVAEHEQKHIAMNQQVFQQYVPVIQQKLQDFLKLNGVLQERNYGYTMTVLHDNMKGIVAQILQDMAQQENSSQAQIDSNADFQTLVQACSGQLALVARNFHTTGR